MSILLFISLSLTFLFPPFLSLFLSLFNKESNPQKEIFKKNNKQHENNLYGSIVIGTFFSFLDLKICQWTDEIQIFKNTYIRLWFSLE